MLLMVPVYCVLLSLSLAVAPISVCGVVIAPTCFQLPGLRGSDR